MYKTISKISLISFLIVAIIFTSLKLSEKYNLILKAPYIYSQNKNIPIQMIHSTYFIEEVYGKVSNLTVLDNLVTFEIIYSNNEKEPTKIELNNNDQINIVLKSIKDVNELQIAEEVQELDENIVETENESEPQKNNIENTDEPNMNIDTTNLIENREDISTENTIETFENPIFEMDPLLQEIYLSPKEISSFERLKQEIKENSNIHITYRYLNSNSNDYVIEGIIYE